jgi:uncharacterized protein (TIGR02611 family)
MRKQAPGAAAPQRDPPCHRAAASCLTQRLPRLSVKSTRGHLVSGGFDLPRTPDRPQRPDMLLDVNDLLRLLRRIAVTVVGTVMLVVGVVLLVAPGPGLVVVALALAIFAIEYQWARRHLAAVQAHARSTALAAAASRAATASTVLFGTGAIGLGVVMVFTDLLPLSGVGTGVGIAVGGLTVLMTMAYGIREVRRTGKAEQSEDAE